MTSKSNGCCVVTGAAGGVGTAVISRLRAAGTTIVAVDLPSERLSAMGRATGVTAVSADLSDPRALDGFAPRVGRPISGIVHAAGNTKNGPVEGLVDAEWDDVLEVHLGSAFRLTRALIPHMVGDAAIVLVSSTSVRGSRYMSNYAAAKAGILGLVRTLAIELGPRGIRANAVVLGAVDTPMLRSGPAEWVAGLPRRIPLRRVGTPAEAAGAIAFLLGHDAAYVTGACLVVDGGYTLGG